MQENDIDAGDERSADKGQDELESREQAAFRAYVEAYEAGVELPKWRIIHNAS